MKSEGGKNKTNRIIYMFFSFILKFFLIFLKKLNKNIINITIKEHQPPPITPNRLAFLACQVTYKIIANRGKM